MAGILTAVMLITAGTYGAKDAVFAEEAEKGRWARTESVMPRSVGRGVVQGEIHDIFPQSYWSYLDALKAAHPNWKFEALDTGLDWSYVIDQEMYPTTNLVESNYYPSSWLDLENFNYKTNSWVIASAPDWVQANRQIVEAYMDPRNFLNEENIFQFEKLTFDGETQTESGVQAILKGTFMETNRLENGMTYSQAFMQIAREVNVSPYHLASRVRQEQGAGNSPLISGTVAGYEGYYNYFNIEASGVTMDEIVRNGLEEAKRNGWNTRYLALQGGASKVASNYITRGQDTLYLQKFDVDPQYNGMFWHQYMQNLSAAESESLSMRKAYVNMGIVNSSFTFKIPVYQNMPGSPTQKPTGTGNPNDRLKSINVNGTELINFDAEDLTNTNYSINVPCNTTTATVNAQPVASTTTVTYNKDTSLSNGNTTNVSIKTQAQNGTTRNYNVAVTADNHNFDSWVEQNGQQVRKCSKCGKIQGEDIGGSGGNGGSNVVIVEDIQVSNVTSDGYRVTVKLGNSGMATEVKFPTWTEKNGQDDLIWYTKNVTSDTVVCDIKTKDHKKEFGKYYTHIYVYNGGQQLGVYEEVITVPEKTTAVPTISASVHVQNKGWQSWTSTGKIGTTGSSLRLEGLKIKLNSSISGNVEYTTHVQNIGWQNWVSNGTLAGTTGKSLRLEAVKIRLSGEIAKEYDIQYRAHSQNVGWMNWVSNGEMAGTKGKSLRLEALEIRLIKK